MCQKSEYNNLLVVIEDLRRDLHAKVGQKSCLQDPEIIELSQKLDGFLNKFYKLSLKSVK